MSEREPTLGIDLGTSKTCVSAADEQGVPRMISDASGRTLISSHVSFDPDGNVLVGAAARARLLVDPRNTVQCDLRPQATDSMSTRAGGVTPAQLESILLDHVRRMADAALGVDSKRVVLTLPAGLAEQQRQDVVSAAGMAALTVEAILTCPAAAAFAYRLDEAPARPVVVVDFGGGKFECTVLEMRGGVPAVLATACDPLLGGIDVDQRIVDGMIEAFQQVHHIDLGADEVAVERLFEVAEQAKQAIGTIDSVTMTVPRIATSIYGKPLDLKIALPRSIFLARTEDLFHRAMSLSQEAMRQAGVAPQQVAEVILVGGMTRMPLLQERIAGVFGRWGRADLAQEEVCALGAARFAFRERQKRFAATMAPMTPTVLADAAMRRHTAPYGSGSAASTLPGPAPGPAPLGAEISGGLATTSATPLRVGRISTKKMFTAVMTAQPDVTFGAPTPILTEVTASPLAVSTVGGFCDELIGANVPIPVANTRVFATGKDGQTAVQVSVCQGPSRRFDDNMPLGTIVLPDLPPRPRGGVRIAVTFSVDADGVLEASARDEATGRAQSIRVQLGARQKP